MSAAGRFRAAEIVAERSVAKTHGTGQCLPTRIAAALDKHVQSARWTPRSLCFWTGCSKGATKVAKTLPYTVSGRFLWSLTVLGDIDLIGENVERCGAVLQRVLSSGPAIGTERVPEADLVEPAS